VSAGSMNTVSSAAAELARSLACLTPPSHPWPRSRQTAAAAVVAVDTTSPRTSSEGFFPPPQPHRRRASERAPLLRRPSPPSLPCPRRECVRRSFVLPAVVVRLLDGRCPRTDIPVHGKGGKARMSGAILSSIAFIAAGAPVA